MKRILSILLSASLLLCGCSAKDGNLTHSIRKSESIAEKNGTTDSALTAQGSNGTIKEASIEYKQASESENEIPDSESQVEEDAEEKEYSGLDDPDFLSDLEEEIYLKTVSELNSEDYLVEDVEVKYISKEYLDEVAYNSKSNIYFGYNIEELNSLFSGTK